jgi:hypothetical protein
MAKVPSTTAMVLAAVLLVAPQARGAELAVDLELVLAVDVSMSMDMDEQKLQRDGYVAAFRHPEVLAAIRALSTGRIAVTYVEWAGVGRQRVVVPWTIVDGESAALFAGRLEAEPILPNRRTSLSSALDFAAGLFDANGIGGVRRVIDISGDGANNQGEPVEGVRERVVARDITINGLPILLKGGRGLGFFDTRDLDVYYEDCVIGGFGAFLVPVTDTAEFATAIRRKLILEISSLAPRLIPARIVAPAREPADCLMGEKQWQHWMLDAN